MLGWITANIGTIIVVLVLLTAVTLIVRNLIKDKKAGKSSCGCNCSGCAMKGACHK